MNRAIGVVVVASCLMGIGVIYATFSPTPTDNLAHISTGSDIGPGMSAAWRAVRSAATLPTSVEPAPLTVVTKPTTKAPVPQKASAMPLDRTSIARELQRELKRVGCYDGEINGAWTPSTRSATKAFTARVNAVLPAEEPDLILLTLVQGQDDKICGTPCPIGQSLVGDGRCLPHAILARTSLPTGPAPKGNAAGPAAITVWSTTITAPTPAPPDEGRMALAGPTTSEPTDTAAPAAMKPAVRAPQRAAAPKRSAFGPAFFKELDRTGRN